MTSARILREKIKGERLTLGIMVTMHLWLEVIEIARNAGLDYLIIDTEHSAWDDELLANACAIGRMIDFPILIRPAETTYRMVRMAVDKGPCGLLLPYVESSATLDEARDRICLPPRGRRRPGGPGNRWVPDYNASTWQETVEKNFIVLPQIESSRGLDNVDEIARHELTTAMAVGPYDLSASLGVCWERNHPRLFEATERIRQAGCQAGKNTWMIGDGPSLIQRGFNFLCLGEPSLLLEATLSSQVTAVRTARGPTPPQASAPVT
jgi:2-keto-3-deoxy-L-rhamnonate aldolase RhmA